LIRSFNAREEITIHDARVGHVDLNLGIFHPDQGIAGESGRMPQRFISSQSVKGHVYMHAVPIHTLIYSHLLLNLDSLKMNSSIKEISKCMENARCTRLFVQTATRNVRFLLSRTAPDLFTAVSATRSWATHAEGTEHESFNECSSVRPSDSPFDERWVPVEV
jgi:hypothetical protein